MQAIHVTVEVNPRDIPSLVCTDYASSSAGDKYTAAIAEAVAENLGIVRLGPDAAVVRVTPALR